MTLDSFKVTPTRRSSSMFYFLSWHFETCIRNVSCFPTKMFFLVVSRNPGKIVIAAIPCLYRYNVPYTARWHSIRVIVFKIKIFDMVSYSSRSMLFVVVITTIYIWEQNIAEGGSIEITENTDQNDIKSLRLQAKPWYMKNISIGENMYIPISPATIIISFFTIFYAMYFYYSSQCFCIASHILVKDTGKETKLKLGQWKDKIGSNSQLFAKYASDYSECPSGKHNGGNLGKFFVHDMAPNFNNICFDKKTQLQTTVGPIQTQFGYHLIYIHERQIPK